MYTGTETNETSAMLMAQQSCEFSFAEQKQTLEKDSAQRHAESGS